MQNKCIEYSGCFLICWMYSRGGFRTQKWEKSSYKHMSNMTLFPIYSFFRVLTSICSPSKELFQITPSCLNTRLNAFYPRLTGMFQQYYLDLLATLFNRITKYGNSRFQVTIFIPDSSKRIFSSLNTIM